MKYENLIPEQQAVMLLSRLTFMEGEEEFVTSLISEKKLDWEYILNVCINNKILGLIWGNLIRLKLEDKVPSRIMHVMRFNFLGIKERTKAYIHEANVIGEALTNHSIKHAFLKGAYLLPNMFKTYGTRNMNDIDILVEGSRSKEIVSIMNELGYLQGEFNKKTGQVEKTNRAKEILWKSNMNNMFPFLKKADSEYINCYKIDFCFSLDLNLKKEDVVAILANESMGILRPSNFFLHLCCHFFKEATNVIWIYNNNDINLIKLCDIREFIIQKMNDESLSEAIENANSLGYSKAIYYTLYCLNNIYQDGYERKWMGKITIDDETFVDKFGGNDFGKDVEWKKDIWQRIFSSNNRDELGSNLPKYKLLD